MEFPEATHRTTTKPGNVYKVDRASNANKDRVRTGALQTLVQHGAPTPHDALPVVLQPTDIVGAALAEDPAELDLSTAAIGSLQEGQISKLLDTLRADKIDVEGIERCHLSGQRLSDEDIVCVAKTLIGCHLLNLERTGMTPSRLNLLLDNLPAEHKLSELNLADNELGTVSGGSVVVRLLSFIVLMVGEDASLNVRGNGFTPEQQEKLRGHNDATKEGAPRFFLDLSKPLKLDQPEPPRFMSAKKKLIAFGQNTDVMLDLSCDRFDPDTEFIELLAAFVKNSPKDCTIFLPSRLPQMEDRFLLIEAIGSRSGAEAIVSFDQGSSLPLVLGKKDALDCDVEAALEKFLSD